MIFRRTSDYGLVKQIITHPQVWPWVADDFTGPVQSFRPTIHQSIYYMLAMDGEELVGMWCFIPHNGVCWEVHTYLLPAHGFKRGREAARGMAVWIWTNTSCRRICTNVPTFNRAARIFARAAGMAEYGLNEKSFMWNGKLYDQVMLGMTKPEVSECPQQ